MKTNAGLLCLLLSILMTTIYIQLKVSVVNRKMLLPLSTLYESSNESQTYPTEIETIYESTKADDKITVLGIKYLKTPTRKYINRSEVDCNGVKAAVNWTIVTFVKSAAQNYRRRELLRRTWASISYVNGGRFETIFVTGKAEGRTQLLLDEEYERYSDILQIDESDDYKNIRLKTLAGMQWAFENLPDDYYYSTADDDFMIDLGGVQILIDKHKRNMATSNMSEFPIICMYKKITNQKPERRNNSKWYTSLDEFKWPVWPDSCLGGMYSTSVKVVADLWEVSKTEKPVNMDDVWITGILREKLTIPRQFVVEANPPVATHFFGYHKKESNNTRNYMWEDWQKIFDKFKWKNLCFHENGM